MSLKFKDANHHERIAMVKEAYGRQRSIRGVARELDVAYGTARTWCHQAGLDLGKPGGLSATTKIGKHKRVSNDGSTHKVLVHGEDKEHPTHKIWTGERRRYIMTCAQNNTRIHEPVWNGLRELAKYYNAELMISRFTYRLDSYGQGEVKPGKDKHQTGVWFDPRIAPYEADSRQELAPGLVWCGELNILPTAITPISGLESYTGRASSIFPHTKVQMESIPSGKHEPTKFCYTTGTITTRNYIQKKAGLKADFHHVYGGLLVEVDEDGDWFVRQLNCDDNGVIYDLDIAYVPGQGVIHTDGVEAINWGDIHVAKLEQEQEQVCREIAGKLKPTYQFMHDLLDFRARNHHERNNPHVRFRQHVHKEESVRDEIQRTAFFLDSAQYWADYTIVVNSNHDMALERWLREADYRNDPVNALCFLELQTQVYRWIHEGVKEERSIVEHAMNELAQTDLASTQFLLEDESFLICNREIECGMHGHAGPDGSRGNRRAFARMGRKSNIGHSHSAGIRDGVYQAGVTGNLNMGYNTGPSSWSHSHIVTYPNAKRAIITVWRNKWRMK